MMGRAWSTYGGEVYTAFWWENLAERDHSEDAGVDRRIIIGWTFRKWDRGAYTGLIDMAQDRDGWQNVANAVMNLRVP
jgi:hypothetical protein